MSNREATINKLRKDMQWNKLVFFLEDIIDTESADFEDYSNYILAVIKSQQSKKYQKAIQCFTKAIRQTDTPPEKLKSLYKQSETIIKHLGLKYFDEQNSNNIDREFYLQARFVLLLNGSRQTEALNCLTELVNTFKKSQYYFQRSKVYAILKKYKESLYDLNSAIKINSKEPEYYYHRAILKKKLHDTSGAYIDIGNAIGLNTENKEYYYTRAVISAEMQKYKNATDDLKKAIILSPKDIKLYQELANCMQNSGKTSEAFSAINTALEINTTDASNYYIRGTLYNQTKKYEEAISDFEFALKYDNMSDKRWAAKIFYQKAWSEFKLKNYPKAQSDIIQTLKLDDKTLAYYYLAMDIEVFGTKDFYKARGYCNQILQKYPDNKRAKAAQEEILKLKK